MPLKLDITKSKVPGNAIYARSFSGRLLEIPQLRNKIVLGSQSDVMWEEDPFRNHEFYHRRFLNLLRQLGV